ncbi:MAG: hypothetical protein ACREJV_09410 [Candidatus Rokuibacteriota bacterium]
MERSRRRLLGSVAGRKGAGNQAHLVAAHMKTFRDELLPMSGSLYDERLYRSID